jgi:hypothetical protein
MLRGLAAEDHQIEQRIRPQAIRAVNRYAGRFAQRHQARHQCLAAAVMRNHLALHIAGNPAHVVVDRRQNRYGFLVDIDAGKNSGGLRDAGQTLLDHRGTQVFEMQINVVFELADAAPFTDLDGHGAAHHIP